MWNFQLTKDGNVETTARGYEVLKSAFLNKGVAFTNEERKALNLEGLLPTGVLSLEEQGKRAYEQLSGQPTPLQKYIYLASLHRRNRVLFFHLLTKHIKELLPIVYTPTVGEAIQHYSHEYRESLGVYLSIDNPEGIETAFRNFGAKADEIDLIVATDGERILGIGDWGVGGIDIAKGKLTVYTAAAGINPMRVIPVILDTGTDREDLLKDPFYIGCRHPRVRGETYDRFIEKYVQTAHKLFPDALLHWEDFAQPHARPILEKYRNDYCTFNDDIQGTGAILLAAVLSAVKASGVPLLEHRIVIFGAGTAGIGIAEQIRDAMVRQGADQEKANRQFWCIDRPGLLTDQTEGLKDFQKPFAREESEVSEWARNQNGGIDFLETVRQVRPTILIGSSTVGGAFTEEIVKEMAKHVEKPVILPLSNPTSKSEAVPEDLIKWTEGRALVATGSPFEPVQYNGQTYVIGQANNSFIFPGIGLGVMISKAKRVTDHMLAKAAEAVAGQVHTEQASAPLLPQVEDLRSVSFAVASAVVQAAIDDGIARVRPKNIENAVKEAMWEPRYPEIHPI
ncbi:NAD-dependent malic enzyme [Heyndrickxia coagulans]|uniref:NAD-dependent malic enzyme n=1 Tax=Heyndrickxia coagulans TaxID=1398 RepID=UPI0007794249|nr:NAD-dependent malic enzyme [Heyndrickxia coagulans]KYC61343.1 NAD-dependent malic enzyme [Heyndrickxia coagulans]